MLGAILILPIDRPFSGEREKHFVGGVNVRRGALTGFGLDHVEIEVAVVINRRLQLFVLDHAAPDDAENIALEARDQGIDKCPRAQFQFLVTPDPLALHKFLAGVDPFHHLADPFLFRSHINIA